MDSYPVSAALKDLLDRKGMRGAAAGTVATRGNKGLGAASDGAAQQVPAKAKGDQPCMGGGIRLVVNNTDFSRGRNSVRPQLKLVSSK